MVWAVQWAWESLRWVGHWAAGELAPVEEEVAGVEGAEPLAVALARVADQREPVEMVAQRLWGQRCGSTCRTEDRNALLAHQSRRTCRPSPPPSQDVP